MVFMCNNKNRRERYEARDTEENRKRVVVTARRCEGVYKLTGEPSVVFCGEEAQRNE